MPPRKAPKNASAAAAVGGRDNISSLPDGVLQHILSFLPALDVVRTCVLAKRWRQMWESSTVLRFLSGGLNEYGKLEEPRCMEEIQVFVDHLLRLRLRQGRPLDTCEFSISPVDIENGESDFDMSRLNLWIRIALQCKVRVLQLSCESIEHVDDHPFFVSQYLRKLELEGLDGKKELLPRRLLDFSCCPNLDDLKIAHCYIEGALHISSPSLKHLTIQNCYFEQLRRMPICTPNLVSLWLEVCNGSTPSLQTMPSLLTACVELHSRDLLTTLDDDKDSNQSILLHGLSEVQNLVLISRDTKSLIRRDLEFCSSFNKLKSLLLNEYWCEPADFSALACILKLSPVLEKLTLQLYSTEPKHKVEIKLICKPDMSAAISQHLKTIEVKCKAYDERVCNLLTFLSKLNIWFQFGG